MSPPNSFGNHFVVTILGESHGRMVGVALDGVPAGYMIDIEKINVEMARRKPGQSEVTTSRAEADQVECLSGLYNGKTTGAPVLLVTWNKDADSSTYEKFKDILRPGHADFTAMLRYGGFNDYRGSGRFSGRLTAGLVMAGAVASQICNAVLPITISAHAREIAGIAYDGKVDARLVRERIESNPVRCYDPVVAKGMATAIEQARNDKDSVGGIVECIIDGLPGGLGDPYFSSVESQLSAMMFSIGAVKGIEFGAGFSAARMKGSEDNDPYDVDPAKTIHPVTNNAGGILGGITTGAPVVFRVVIKPTASITRKQKTVDVSTRKPVDLVYEGRHDPCIVPRAVPVIEHATAIVVLDLLLGAGIVPRVAR
ncbi:MAG: chorismate synthase [Candidatus Lokiarchaeota archaeon]|nr:chorismate synthase [Candidatus Lokiarchaeota archaeon]